jgi:glycosyltransferase involved in cell wall biosynthesis
MRMLVMLPALNEAATVVDVIRRIPRDIEGIDQVEVLVVDDGSTDETAELARGAGASVISHGVNRGVGAAIQTGLAEAIRRQVDIAVNMDADGQFDPSDIRKLIRPVLDRRADMATASRFKDRELVPTMPVVKRFGNWGMARLVSFLAGGSYEDVSCGFRAYSREALLRLVLTGAFTYTQESFLVLAAKGMRIQEVPLTVRGVREHGQSRVASNLVRYALRTSSIIFASVRDYRPAKVFGSAALGLFVVALGFAGFFVWHRIVAGQFSPNIWAGFVAAFVAGLSVLVFALGQIAEMISNLRLIQEQQLYLLRRLDGVMHEQQRVSTALPPRPAPPAPEVLP